MPNLIHGSLYLDVSEEFLFSMRDAFTSNTFQESEDSSEWYQFTPDELMQSPDVIQEHMEEDPDYITQETLEEAIEIKSVVEEKKPDYVFMRWSL